MTSKEIEDALRNSVKSGDNHNTEPTSDLICKCDTGASLGISTEEGPICSSYAKNSVDPKICTCSSGATAFSNGDQGEVDECPSIGGA